MKTVIKSLEPLEMNFDYVNSILEAVLADKRAELNINVYYVGGSLCIDSKCPTDASITYCTILNLNKTGNADFAGDYPFDIPDHIYSLLKKLYLKVKGNTDFYKNTIKA